MTRLVPRPCPGPFHDGLVMQLRMGVPVREIGVRYGLHPLAVFAIASWANRPDEIEPPAEVLRWLDTAPATATEKL